LRICKKKQGWFIKLPHPVRLVVIATIVPKQGRRQLRSCNNIIGVKICVFLLISRLRFNPPPISFSFPLSLSLAFAGSNRHTIL
jgi:hypothetical protein